jgi:alanine racemase
LGKSSLGKKQSWEEQFWDMSNRASRADRPEVWEMTEPLATNLGPAESEAGGVLTVDLSAIEANWRSLLSRVSPAECSAVVKADAYGCGLEPVVRGLANAKCKTFFVAHLSEARRVRDAVPDSVVYVLNGIPPGSAPAFADAYARPVIGSLSELTEWDAFCRANNWRWGAALHFDTGMNRLGLTTDEAIALSTRVKGLDHGITLVMSHLACADDPSHPLNDRQIQLFRELRMMYRGITASLANSSGIFLGPATHCDLVRPGLALYGSNPTPGAANPMRPVVGLKGRIIQVRHLLRGASVGYGATWTAPRTSRVAIISVGYGDGYPRAADEGANAFAIVAGQRCPLVGRISMDSLAVDVTAVAEKDVKRGDFATLLGGEIGVDDLARWSGTIGYEVLTRLGSRYARVYGAG